MMEPWFAVFNFFDSDLKLVTAFGLLDSTIIVPANRRMTPEEIERAKEIAEEEFKKSGNAIQAL